MSKKEIIKIIKDTYTPSSLNKISFFELRKNHYQLETYSNKDLCDICKLLGFEIFGECGIWAKIKQN